MAASRRMLMVQGGERLKDWARGLMAVLLAAPLLLAATTALAAPGRLALVEPDGALRIGTKIVRLYGIYIPETTRTCRSFLQPVRCGPRAVLALERKIHGFVYCEYLSRNRDRSVNAVCRVDSGEPYLGAREDLAVFLLREGWAVAVPGAPFAYRTQEKIARVNRRGIWGFQADSVRAR